MMNILSHKAQLKFLAISLGQIPRSGITGSEGWTYYN